MLKPVTNWLLCANELRYPPVCRGKIKNSTKPATAIPLTKAAAVHESALAKRRPPSLSCRARAGAEAAARFISMVIRVIVASITNRKNAKKKTVSTVSRLAPNTINNGKVVR